MEREEPSKAEHQEVPASNGVHLPKARRPMEIAKKAVKAPMRCDIRNKLENSTTWQAAIKKMKLLSECFIHKNELVTEATLSNWGETLKQAHKVQVSRSDR